MANYKDSIVKTDKMLQYDRLIKSFADPCKGIIYHYTSVEGLRGIIENSEIWLTNVSFLNDTTECRALEEKKSLFDDSEFTNNYVKKRWKRFASNTVTDYDTYIASFSSGNESLDQWRAYGNFRVGFEANKLIKRRFNMYKCIYSEAQIKKWIQKKEKVEEWTGNCLDDEYKRGAASHLIYAASKKYKNKHFKNEKEFRLVVVSHHTWDPYTKSPSMFKDDPPIYYRDHPVYKVPVPYVKYYVEKEEELADNQDEIFYSTRRPIKEIDFKKNKIEKEKNNKKGLLPIKEVLVGPMLHKKEAEIACKILLRDKGYKKVKVRVSKMPYRGF